MGILNKHVPFLKLNENRVVTAATTNIFHLVIAIIHYYLQCKYVAASVVKPQTALSSSFHLVSKTNSIEVLSPPRTRGQTIKGLLVPMLVASFVTQLVA